MVPTVYVSLSCLWRGEGRGEGRGGEGRREGRGGGREKRRKGENSEQGMSEGYGMSAEAYRRQNDGKVWPKPGVGGYGAV